MKKTLSIIVILLLPLMINVNSKKGNTVNTNTVIGKSVKFTQDEISEAMNCVKSNFKNFTGCTLTRLSYDEEMSTSLINAAADSADSYVHEIKEENTMIITSNFNVDSSGGDGSLNPNSTYTDWKWILEKDKDSGYWFVRDSGY